MSSVSLTDGLYARKTKYTLLAPPHQTESSRDSSRQIIIYYVQIKRWPKRNSKFDIDLRGHDTRICCPHLTNW